MTATDELLTAAEVARITTLSKSALGHLRARGDGPAYIRLGCRRVAYRRSDVEAWIEQQRQEPRSQR